MGINWVLLYKPRTWAPSTNVLFWDVLAFYLPVVLTAPSGIETVHRRLRPHVADAERPR